MELNTHICNQLIEKGNAFTQITVDDDYIVRDNKPDVVRIIYTKGRIALEDAKVGNQVVWLTGKLHFDTLYLSDDENRRLECVSGEVPFQEKLIMDEVGEGDELFADAKIEDLSVGIINSRKLVVRGVLNLTAEARRESENVVACAVPKEMHYEQKTKSVDMMCLTEAKKDIVRIQKELLLPNSRTNIGTIIFYQVDFRNEDVQLKSDGIQIQMDAQVWVLYRSETTGEYECFETVVPVMGMIESSYLVGDEIFWTKIRPMEIDLEPRGDYDGEARMLGLEVMLAVEAEIYREESCDVLLDVYSLQKELVLQKEPFELSQLLMKNISKIRILEQAHLEPNQEKILQICGSNGMVGIDRIQRKENGLLVEGILQVHILYNAIEDSMPYGHSEEQIPFEQFIEIDNFSNDARFKIEIKLEQLQVNLLDNTEYEIKAVLQMALLAEQVLQFEKIVEIEERPFNIEELQKQPGMIGCVRKEGEDLWDIAKRYHATAENIIEIGDKVLVVKQVLS
ncbi:MAG: DUF3794 domain-containing protein [Lachnospiraceae bacterium]|nr:DUF3794 domain-containing protein [Lachnospiraceae bacterium]